MRAVKNHLVACVSVDCRHNTALNGSIFVKCICHRCQAVCCARCSRDDFVIFCKSFFVYAVNDSFKVFACGSRDNNLFSACVNMSLALIFGAVETCALQNNVNADFAPGELGSVCFFINCKGFAVYCDCVSFVVSFNSVKIFADFAAVSALCCVVFQQISKHRGLCEVVDSNNIITFCTKHLTESQTSDTTETVNRNFYCHNNFPPKINIIFYFVSFYYNLKKYASFC